MTFVNALLWPGTYICKMMGIDPEADFGLVRSMFNAIIYLTVFLIIAWWIMAS